MASRHNTGCKSLRNRFRCPHCGKGYMMEWAHANHIKVCVHKFRK